MPADTVTEPSQVPAVLAEVTATTDATAPSPKSRRPRRRSTKGSTKTAEDGSAAADVQQEEDNTHKVFVGNLAFATTEEELKQFGSPAGEVVKVEIILRGTRSLGYGFISFNNEEDASKAVTLLDKKELGSRQVNVESAKLRKVGELKPRSGRARRGRGRGYLGRGRGRFTSTGDEKRVDDEQPAEGTEEGEKSTEGRTRAGRRRGQGRRAPRGRVPRADGEPRPEVTGDLSDTGLFVANLPFKVTDDDLKAIFKDYKVTKARVVRLRSGRSKGFGFVEVDSKVEQDRIVTELKNVVVEGRELVIKVALANQTAPEAVAAEEVAITAA
ncbi:hypothetical protein HK096_008839 [Nowakowskiella sp. JEL0078]|nr:hypothetical protein HK096_008839 [Nowakowskiella sp. JEL0078]